MAELIKPQIQGDVLVELVEVRRAEMAVLVLLEQKARQELALSLFALYVRVLQL